MRRNIYTRKNIPQRVTTPWIYHSKNLGLISLSGDWVNWITIADKNLWATIVYNNGDVLSEANCGKYFQRWNNYWFSQNWIITTSNIQVDASNYWPWNYYNSDIFIIGQKDWSSITNNDLRGGETDTLEARQGPAPKDFHIPSQIEWKTVIDMFNLYGEYGPAMKNYFKMPYVWDREYSDSNISDFGTRWYYWTSTPTNETWLSPEHRAGCLSFNDLTMDYYNWFYRGYGFSLRCFKNEPEIPYTSRIVLYQPN